jgi:hypothetical protein
MPRWFTVPCLPLIRGLGRHGPDRDPQRVPSPISLPIRESKKPMGNFPYSPVHILNDDVLLIIFRLYRLDAPDEDEDKNGELKVRWDRQRRWYKPAQVCRRWRHLILASPSHLDLHLICTHGVPVADMLEHSPPLPIIIDYWDKGRNLTAEDEEGVLLALSHRGRLRRIRFLVSTPSPMKFVASMDDQFPILERLYIVFHTEGPTAPVFPKTFQAPKLRRIGLWKASLSTGPPLFTTSANLVTLILANIKTPQFHLTPSDLLNGLSLMYQLEVLVIDFHYYDVDAQLSHIPKMIKITLPNLRWFWFGGKSTYLEVLVARINTPVLSNFQIRFYNQLTVSIPHLSQFIYTLESLSFRAVWLDLLSCGFTLGTVYQGKPTTPAFTLQIFCDHLDLQVSSAVHILNTLHPVLSVVEQLTLRHEQHHRSSERHNVVDRTQWRELLRPFNNVKTLYVQNELVGKISCSLRSGVGQPPEGLLPNLKELRYSGGSYALDAFAPFVDGRQAAGHSVNLIMVDDSVFWSRKS